MNYQPLFDYLANEHGLNFLQNELDEIVRIVDKIKPQNDAEQSELPPVGDLLPCPFCGSECEIEDAKFGDSITHYYRAFCKQHRHALDCWQVSKEEATRDWNSRCIVR